MTATIFWYDLETTGTDAARDRPLQFAGVRTDLNLEVLGEPENFFCMPGDDILPDPGAIAVTGINMEKLAADGLKEADFAAKVRDVFSKPNTCVAGFNSIRFDDEFVRQMLYRNFYDPYSREWRNGNSRWDVMDLMRTACALRPEGVNWPLREDGNPGFRLEELTAENGIAHEDAHDALADVLATIEMARKVKLAQPRLYDYLYNLRSKQLVFDQLYPLGKEAVVHVSGMYPASRCCTSLVLPLCRHPSSSNGILCFDLMADPGTLLDATAEEIHRLTFSKREQLGENEKRIALKVVHANRCPSIAPASTLDDATALRLGIDKALCLETQARLQKASGLVGKIQDAWQMASFDETSDPDLMLYSGDFFTDADISLMEQLHGAKPESLTGFENRFKDDRLNEMLFRYRARNYPETLSSGEQTRWQAFKRQGWVEEGRLQAVETKLAGQLADADLPETSRTALEALERHLLSLKRDLVA